MSNPAVAPRAKPPSVTARRRRFGLGGSWLAPDLLFDVVETGWELSMRFRSAGARVGFGRGLCSAASMERRNVSRF